MAAVTAKPCRIPGPYLPFSGCGVDFVALDTGSREKPPAEVSWHGKSGAGFLSFLFSFPIPVALGRRDDKIIMSMKFLDLFPLKKKKKIWGKSQT